MPLTPHNGAARWLVPFLCLAPLLAGCTEEPRTPASPSAPPSASAAFSAPPPTAGPPGRHATREDARPRAVAGRLPGVGPATGSRIPGGTRQALVVIGETPDTSVATAVLYEQDGTRRWRRTAGPWPAHNALRGWTSEHWEGDLRTPIGVFGLGNAGGRLPDPGALLPYDQNEEFAALGTGFLGEPLEGSFDHVVAIDYNRIPGTTPLDRERPLGTERGGGVWIHVDHAGPTQGCISLPREAMRELLRALDPDKQPVIVMGPAAELAQ
ncbi:L,D-transpeptidase family protein [Streptomyces sp. ISL-10]|uniref:L,D-transpeptidase family protein n=1 Tax=Streptomyces sp. ISL-10 TaxID=2819172 RepID=UPI001BE6CCF6|nr:L,D-transpeptidase family protein [Streptomyces sp. ISL-10]MBT2365948.1 L,D-transpeptidase family protein [Streptomyces sp. ISL-10]